MFAAELGCRRSSRFALQYLQQILFQRDLWRFHDPSYLFPLIEHDEGRNVLDTERSHIHVAAAFFTINPDQLDMLVRNIKRVCELKESGNVLAAVTAPGSHHHNKTQFPGVRLEGLHDAVVR